MRLWLCMNTDLLHISVMATKYRIALTGGIGTGKTYLSRHFVQMGIPVFYADDEAKALYRDEAFVGQLCALFGKRILDATGQVDRQVLADIIFNDGEQLARLEQLVHPAVMQRFEQWAEIQPGNAVMMESAVVFERGLDVHFDKVIVADAPLELRIKRVLKRAPGTTREQVLQRMATQMPQEEKCRRADLVVCTGETYCEAEKGVPQP